MDRKISWKLYLTALIISIIVFSAGIAVGLFLTQSVNDSLQNELSGLRSRTTELELLFLLNSSSNLCSFYSQQVKAFDQDTSSFGAKLDFLEKKRGRLDQGVRDLKKEFSVMQLRDYLFVSKFNEVCPQKIDSLLFFYTNENCPECTKQGLVGPDLKQKHPDLMIYAFDVDLNSPAVEALRELYAINSYPSIVLNGVVFNGYQSSQEIESLLN
ncbi:hypothetical protein HUU53_04760 [Candidatus Micrarchaeota archaeon]|nr:hypothetical protein [Candidatus Micrarchaeota archaeon]